MDRRQFIHGILYMLAVQQGKALQAAKATEAVMKYMEDRMGLVLATFDGRDFITYASSSEGYTPSVFGFESLRYPDGPTPRLSPDEFAIGDFAFILQPGILFPFRKILAGTELAGTNVYSYVQGEKT